MKRLAAFFIACLPVLAQSCVQIVDTLGALGPGTPGLMNGTITLATAYTPVVAGQSFPQGATQITVVNGLLNTCQPAGAIMTATYSAEKTGTGLTGSVTSVRQWTIPVSGGPYTLYGNPQIETSLPPAPALVGPPPVPPSSGTYCLISTNGVLSWSSLCGYMSLSLSSLTNSELTSLTNAQLSSLTN